MSEQNGQRAASSWAHQCRECEWFMRQGCDAICRVQDKMVNPYGTACVVYRPKKHRPNEEPCSYRSIGLLRPVRSEVFEVGDGKRNPKGCYIRIKSKKYEE